MANETNPYLNARKEWLERYGEYIAQARTWRLVAMMSLAVAAIAVVGLVVLATQHKIVPFVVAVDELGNELAIGRADVAAQVDDRVVRSMLARWVVDCRTVYGDATAQRGMVDEAYKLINRREEAYQLLNAWYRENNPFEREQVQVRVQSVLRISADTWRAEWEEVTGENMEGEQYQATITVQIAPPTDERIAIENPLGVYVDYFQWGVRL